MERIGIVLVLCLFMVCIVSSDVGIVVLRPTESELRGVNYADTVYHEIAVWVNNGSPVAKDTVICGSEVLPELEHGGSKKMCVAGSKFYMSGFMTGTSLMNITAERLADGGSPEDSGEVYASELLLIDAVDSEVMQVHIDKGQLSRDLSTIAPGLQQLDYFFYSNPFPAAPQPADFTVLAATHTEARAGAHSAGVDIACSLGERRVRVALWARIAPQFVPSDRFLDWICDHAFLAAQGVDVVVIAPAADKPDSAVPTICGAPVVYFACLREADAGAYSSSSGAASLLSDPAVLPLVQYLSQHVGALLVVNSYGDAQTSLLLDVVQAVKLHGSAAAPAFAKGTAPATDRQPPLVIMDLPNLSLTQHWNGKVDGFIAPSRAVALHYDTIAHKRPVAVIYPPARDLIIQSSICAAEYFYQYGQGEENTKPPSARQGASAVSTAALAPLLDLQHFNVIFVGRLARIKSPGLLIKALGYLLASAEFEWEEMLADTADLGEEDIDRRYARELRRILELHEITINEGDGESLRADIVRVLDELRATVRITFIGGGTAALTEALRGLAGALNVSAQVALMGAQAPERVVQYMQQAHVLVNPRVPGETFGFIHLEAAAQGLPVIAFDMCANAESVVLFDDNQSNSTSSGGSQAGRGVQSALLPYREGAVVQDLALALLTAFLEHKRGLLSAQQGESEASMNKDGEILHDALFVKEPGRRGGKRKEKVCKTVLPMLRHWNNRQHSRALVEALAMFLPSVQSQS